MSKQRKPIPLTIEDVEFIFNSNMDEFYFVVNNCFCTNCEKGSYTSVVVNYTIALNDLNDIIVEGVCQDCHNKLNRYIETGDNPDTAKNADAIRRTNMTLKELKIKKMK